MKKIFALIIVFLFSFNANYAQQTIAKPGLDKFMGRWQYVNGSDTITFMITAHYFSINNTQQLKVIAAYYDYKSGSNYIYQNTGNVASLVKDDFVGSYPYGGLSLDTIEISGTDKLKRKTDEGIFVISNNNNQLKYKRYIGIGGGGMRAHEPGQGPLPGFTLPYEFILTRIPIPSEEKGNKN